VGDPATIAEKDGSGFFFTRIAATDVAAIRRFEDAGFRVVDMTITLDAPVAALPAGDMNGARFARPTDRAAVAGIAANSFSLSRFHLDPEFPRLLADRTREAWAANFFDGQRGDAMIVGENDGQLAAFMLLLGPQSGMLTIDLIAVDPRARRHGYGTACIRFAVTQIAAVERLRVSTQAANVGSLRFYESLGFRASATHYVLHLHRSEP
jgi:ribosomal protein S18 acetylase RimI-like enzyme